MNVYSLRNLLICFAIVLSVVLWIVFYTFSTLRSQEKEQVRIRQSREILKISGPAINNMQELETLRANYYNTYNNNLLNEYDEALKRVQSDSAKLAKLAGRYAPGSAENAATYQQLIRLIHQMTSYSTSHLRPSITYDTQETGMAITEKFKSRISELEDRSREVLNESYTHSMKLTRETITAVTVIVTVLSLVLIVSFSFIYLDIKNKKRKENQLTKFNEELEKQVNEKTATISESEQRLKLIYNTAMDVIFLISIDKGDFVVSSVNKAFLTTTGLREKEVVGRYITEVIPEPSLSMVLEKYRQSIETRQSVQWEEISNYPAGQKTGIVTITPVFNQSGECTMLVGVVHDISERKKAERELIEAESKFRNLVEQSLIGVYIIQKGKFAYVNPRFAEIFGYSQQELIDTDPAAVIMDHDKERITENVRARMAGEVDSIHYEANGQRKGGEMIEIEVFCSGTLYEGSKAIIGTLLDITDRKKAEREMVVANERFSLIAKATNDAVWDWDMVNDRNWGNEIFYWYYGTQPEDPSSYDTFITRVHPDDRKRIQEKLKRAIDKKEDVILDEFRFRLPDGTYHYFYDRAYIIYDNEGKPLRMLGSMMDVSEKHFLEQEILDQRIQAQKMITRAMLKAEERERNKIGQELHDNVNQILVSIKLFLGMTKGKSDENAEQFIQKSIGLIDNAIQEVRDLSQRQVTPLKEINLEELIQLLMLKLRESSHLKTSLVYNLDGQEIEDDLKLNIYRIIQEQFNNIIKYAEASAVSIMINGDQKFLHVLVEDNGKGFDTSAKRMGIGISNMINRIESFNGEVVIDSSPGNGCRINIKIPVEQ
jgi:PAS domain S-box-containing protein